MPRQPMHSMLTDVLATVPADPPREAASLTEAVLRHLKGPPTGREETAWALLAQGLLASCDQPWSDRAARRTLLRLGRAQHGARHAVVLRGRCLLLAP